MSICSCISYGIHKDNVLEVSKRNMRLPQARPNMKVAGETKVAEPEKNGEVAAHNNNKRS